jgi:hypothetical protein
MSWECHVSWSTPHRSVGESIIEPNMGIWLFDRMSIMSVPESQCTTAPNVSSGVDEKRWK